jgi:hypothetical protein
MSDVATKSEVLQGLTKQLRRKDELDDKTFIKLVTLFGKLSGWFVEPTPSLKQPVVKAEPSALDLALKEERLRRGIR